MHWHLEHPLPMPTFVGSKSITLTPDFMPSGRKRKRHKIATHKRKKRLRKNRHKKKGK